MSPIVDRADQLFDLAREFASAASAEAVIRAALAAVLEASGGSGALLVGLPEMTGTAVVTLGALGEIPQGHRVGDTCLTDSVAARVVRTGAAEFVSDLDHELIVPRPVATKLRPGYVVPVRSGSDVVASLTIWTAAVPAPDAEEVRFVQAVADHLGVALDSLFRQSLLQRRLAQVDALGRVAHALTSADDAERTMQFVISEGLRVFEAQRAAIFLLEPAGQASCLVSFGLSHHYLELHTAHFDQTAGGQAVRASTPWYSLDARADAEPVLRAAVEADGFRAVAMLPLLFAGEPIGALAFYFDRAFRLAGEERRLAMAFADQAALAIGKSRLLDLVTRIKRECQSAYDCAERGMAVIDDRGRILRANRFVAELAGVDVRQLPGYDLRGLFAGWPAEAGVAAGKVPRELQPTLVEGKGGRSLVVRVTRLDSRSSVLTIDDLTEELALRERIHHTERMAALGRVVIGAVHEVNNPLTAISAIAQGRLLEANLDRDTTEGFEEIRREALRASRIINTLLAFARHQPLRGAETDLNVLASESARVENLMQGDGEIEVTLALDATLPLILADADQLRQVLTNLVRNATYSMRVSAERRLTLRTWQTAGHVHCAVQDTGPGIPPEALSRIFEPFFTTKSVGEGTGLGLALSEGIVRAHGGELSGANNPEGGAIFQFALPRTPILGARGLHD